jgi:hypothetical protein
MDIRIDRNKRIDIMKRTFALWILAIVITLASAVYQRMTGPSHPVSGSIKIDDSNISYTLLRNHKSTSDANMEIVIPNMVITGTLSWRRFKSNDSIETDPLVREGDKLIATIPKQPAAGKVSYQIKLYDEAGVGHDLTDQPVVMRFKDPVPLPVIIAHVLLIFMAMLYSTRTGLEAIFKGKNIHGQTVVTVILFLIGGMIMGPVVQKYAFGAFWTGWPIGHDLTDNKTAVATIFWLIALWRLHKGKGRGWVIAASLVTLAVFLIPHSVLGSEIDYTKMPQ